MQVKHSVLRAYAVSDDLLRPPTHPEVVVLAPPQIQLFVHDTGACGLSHSTWTGGEGSDHTTTGVEVATNPDSISRSRLRRVTAARACVGCSSAGLRSCVRCAMPSLPSYLDHVSACPAGGDFTSRPSPAGGDSPSRVGLAGRGRGRGGR